MRGRVGAETTEKRFRYLITPPFDMMTSDAENVLEAMSSFQIWKWFPNCDEDLEIRGWRFIGSRTKWFYQ